MPVCQRKDDLTAEKSEALQRRKMLSKELRQSLNQQADLAKVEAQLQGQERRAQVPLRGAISPLTSVVVLLKSQGKSHGRRK